MTQTKWPPPNPARFRCAVHLTAIHEFDRNKYELTNLVKWPELNGRTYDALPSKVSQGIDRRYLSSVILLKETAHSEEDALRLKQLVFERINSGGVRLSPPESRNALFDGPMNQLCIQLSRHPGALPPIEHPRAGTGRASG